MKIRQHKQRLHDEAPDQIEIRDGKLVAIDGSAPDFSEMADGKYNLISRDEFRWYKERAFLAANWAS